MGQQSITIQIIVKGDDTREPERRVREFFNSWFHEDRASAPPFEQGSLLWWGFRDIKEVNVDLQNQDTENIMAPAQEEEF